MAMRLGGSKRKSRHKLQKHFRRRGKISIPSYMQLFKTGDLVVLKADSSINHGIFDPKFYGRTARVIGARGRSYEVELNDGGKRKMLIVHPIHLIRS